MFSPARRRESVRYVIAGEPWWLVKPAGEFCTPLIHSHEEAVDAERKFDYGGLHGYGFSIDVEYQRIHSDLRNVTFTGGFCQNGETSLNKFTVNGGYMIYRDKVELAGSYALLTASNYTGNWGWCRVGLNYFVHEYTVRFSADVTFNANAYGTPGAWENVGRLQAQFAW